MIMMCFALLIQGTGKRHIPRTALLSSALFTSTLGPILTVARSFGASG